MKNLPKQSSSNPATDSPVDGRAQVTKSNSTSTPPFAPPSALAALAAPGATPLAITPIGSANAVTIVTPAVGTAPPSEALESLGGRIEKLFGATIRIANLKEAQTHGPFLDRLKAVKSFDDPVFVLRCGEETGLAAIIMRIDSFDLMDAMYRANPWMLDTLTTVWHTLYFFWFRLEGYRPQNRDVSEACWLLTETAVPIHDLSGQHYRPELFPLRNTEIPTLRFDQINWCPIEEATEDFALEAAERAHGKVFTVGARGRTTLNQTTAVAAFKKMLGLKWNPKDDRFTTTFHVHKDRYLPTNILTETIGEFLTTVAANQGVKLPDGNLAAETIEGLKQLDRIDAATGLTRFVSECLVHDTGSNVVMAELLEAYTKFCRDTGAEAYPERKFYQTVTVAISERFGAAKAHDISRPRPDGTATSKYGFRGLAIKRSDAPVIVSEAPEHSEACSG